MFCMPRELLSLIGLTGNYVVMRSTGEKTFETMPLYARIGMHLLFYGSLQVSEYAVFNSTATKRLAGSSPAVECNSASTEVGVDKT